MNNLTYGNFHQNTQLPSVSCRHTVLYLTWTFIQQLVPIVVPQISLISSAVSMQACGECLNMSACGYAGMTHYNVNVDLTHEY